jgi:hypothetical protein
MGSFADLYGQDRTDMRDAALMKDADDIFKTAVEVAKHDPIAATKLFQSKAEKNKFLVPLKDVVFRRTFDGKAIMEVEDDRTAQRGVINVTDMLAEVEAAEREKGLDLSVLERATLARKYFYPSQGV